jgi:hypothetical protein
LGSQAARISADEEPAADQLSNVNLALSQQEATELRDALGDLLKVEQEGWHVHVSSSDYSREVRVYREDDATLR